MPVQTSYDNEMQIAMPGMRSDSSLQNTDGCSAAKGKIYPGYFTSLVSVANDKRVVKQVSETADGASLHGLCRFSHYGCVKGYYDDGDAVNNITFGRGWAVTPDATAPAKGTLVQVVTSGANAAKGTATASGTTTAARGWVFTGRYTKFKDHTGATVNLAEVQIRNQTAEPVAP